jgi:hypothetical protein
MVMNEGWEGIDFGIRVEMQETVNSRDVADLFVGLFKDTASVV